jgi:hypothetical protein
VGNGHLIDQQQPQDDQRERQQRMRQDASHGVASASG